MRSLFWLALGVGLLPAAVQAQTIRHLHHVHRLPAVSGTIRVPARSFGIGMEAPLYVRRAAPLPQVITGGLWPSRRRLLAIRQDSSGQPPRPVEPWMTGGTGLRGVIGNTGNPFAGQAAWGTADSATTGSGSFGGAWGAGPERRLVERYGEPAIYPTAYDLPSYGAAPQLGFYGSGTPYSLPYYSSGSSAGPYGSPGGLATYRSGSYGYGPRIISIPGARFASRGCACGPRIVRLRRRHHAVVVD